MVVLRESAGVARGRPLETARPPERSEGARHPVTNEEGARLGQRESGEIPRFARDDEARATEGTVGKAAGAASLPERCCAARGNPSPSDQRKKSALRTEGKRQDPSLRSGGRSTADEEIKKGPDPCGSALLKFRRRHTLPGSNPVPSALAGLTSLFGMGRGGHCRYYHLKIVIISIIVQTQCFASLQ